MSHGLSTPEDVKRRLEQNLASRGYLLPHQGLMAVAMPALQDGYKVMYGALTVQQNHLTPFEREFVWLCILVAAGESIGTHHVKLFLELGGTHQQAEAVFRVVNLAAGAPKSFQFLHEHWEPYFAPLDATASYRGLAELAVHGTNTPLELARLGMIAVHTTLSQKWGIRQELEASYEVGVDEGKLAESVCLPMWATGMNRTIEAAEIWLDLIRTGKVQASAPFQTWAEVAQDGMAVFAAK
ncbi:hypothetical protein PT7_2680 [Pusillimonas sp. T7-7]|uniref:hypothetical protein n=1 Tax=Pusillimonas sp. (strain T7-7) TaxID=1007105 RepID=UPI0002084F60|nr:hypothetical protein [Pusillimonas sp. T7-7]AEC21220.1 hypothetical protein PT7_2680 [Pusillimonas sp. T7-7]